jgi:hypothetical protein
MSGRFVRVVLQEPTVICRTEYVIVPDDFPASRLVELSEKIKEVTFGGYRRAVVDEVNPVNDVQYSAGISDDGRLIVRPWKKP